MVSSPFFETTCLYILLQFLRFHYHHLHHISIVLPQLSPTSTSPLFFIVSPLLLFISVVLPILPSAHLLTYLVFPPYIPPPPPPLPSPPPPHYLPHIYPSPTLHQPLVLEWDEVEIELPWPGYTTLLMLKEERLNQSQYLALRFSLSSKFYARKQTS